MLYVLNVVVVFMLFAICALATRQKEGAGVMKLT